jgi:PPOX class probable F420-dependent enzyme
MVRDGGRLGGSSGVDLGPVEDIARAGRHLAVVATTRGDGSIQASLVSAGVMRHPVDGSEVVAFVAYPSVKLRNLRARPAVTAVFLAGPRWVAVEGQAQIAGPDDHLEGVGAPELPRLLRAIFRRAGGSHDDWDTYDRVMAEQRRAAVMIRPVRIYPRRA